MLCRGPGTRNPEPQLEAEPRPPHPTPIPHRRRRPPPPRPPAPSTHGPARRRGLPQRSPSAPAPSPSMRCGAAGGVRGPAPPTASKGIGPGAWGGGTSRGLVPGGGGAQESSRRMVGSVDLFPKGGVLRFQRGCTRRGGPVYLRHHRRPVCHPVGPQAGRRALAPLLLSAPTLTALLSGGLAGGLTMVLVGPPSPPSPPSSRHIPPPCPQGVAVGWSTGG